MRRCFGFLSVRSRHNSHSCSGYCTIHPAQLLNNIGILQQIKPRIESTTLCHISSSCLHPTQLCDPSPKLPEHTSSPGSGLLANHVRPPATSPLHPPSASPPRPLAFARKTKTSSNNFRSSRLVLSAHHKRHLKSISLLIPPPPKLPKPTPQWRTPQNKHSHRALHSVRQSTQKARAKSCILTCAEVRLQSLKARRIPRLGRWAVQRMSLSDGALPGSGVTMGE